MSQTDRQRLWRVECVECHNEWVGVDKTARQADDELSDLGWKEIDGLWFCEECRIEMPTAARSENDS